MTTLFLIRHGETDAVGKSIAGWKPGIHLNKGGEQQASSLKKRLARFPIQAIYTSPLERAVETARPLAAELNLELLQTSELGEMRFGNWESRVIHELNEENDWRRFNTFRSGVRAPGGELMVQTQSRFVDAVVRMYTEHKNQMVALVSHADPIRSVLAYFLGIPIDLMGRLEISPASVSILQLGDWAPSVLCINETGDLAL